MSDDKNKKEGGFHFGNVSGGVKVEAGGDVVGRDKTTTSSTTTNIGFKQEEDKQQFIQQIDELRSAMREIKSQVESAPEVDEDFKDDLVMEIMQQISDLKETKEGAEELPVGEQPPSDKTEGIEKCLDKAGGLLEKIQGMGEKAVEFAGKAAPIIGKSLAILAGARQLFGIP